MAVGDTHFPIMYPIEGVRIAVSEAYIRYANRKDLVIFEFSPKSTVAGVFTQSAFAAAPVILSRQHLSKATPQYLMINAGNANAATGEAGLQAAKVTCQTLADLVGVETEKILPFSTGVIGEQLPVEKFKQAISPVLQNLKADNWVEAAHGIMTTDTVPKGASEQFELDGHVYSMTGISKGAGMIRPNMATMLSFVATDAPISQSLTELLLKTTVEQSFNRITVDGDTSTNDSCIFIATGQAGGKIIESTDDIRYQKVLEVLSRIMLRLAQLIIRDGEGATKFITVTVKGGANTQECCDVAYSVAESPLIKTALFASDPNWGRIVMAIGKAGVENLDSQKVQIWLGDVQICRNGAIADDYTEAAGAKVFAEKEITISIDLGRGQAQDTVYTCDFSYEYVKINADYRS